MTRNANTTWRLGKGAVAGLSIYVAAFIALTSIVLVHDISSDENGSAETGVTEMDGSTGRPPPSNSSVNGEPEEGGSGGGPQINNDTDGAVGADPPGDEPPEPGPEMSDDTNGAPENGTVGGAPDLSDEESTANKWIGQVLRSVAMIVLAMGASSYIYVGARAPQPNELHLNGLMALLMLPELASMMLSQMLALDGNLSGSAAFDAVGYFLRPFIMGLFIRLVKQKICSLGPPPAGRWSSPGLWADLLMAVCFSGPFCGLVPLSIYRAYLLAEGSTYGSDPRGASVGGPGSGTGGGTGGGPSGGPGGGPSGGGTGGGPSGGGPGGGGGPSGGGPGGGLPPRRIQAVEGGGQAVLPPSAEGDVLDALTYVATGALVLLAVMYAALVVVSSRYARTALARLRDRAVTEEQLSRVRRMVRRHFLGMLSGFVADLSFIVVTTLDLQNNDSKEDQQVHETMTSIASLIDACGDTIGIFLLSGLGLLLLNRGKPDAGDVSGKIRGLMHSAVLTSRADTVFEGRMARTENLRCVASFPGKYVREWNALTWLCEEGNLSCACVFLPRSDPRERFGKHVECPETPGKCWCPSLYGDVQPWGCKWFDVWRQNVEEAVSLGLKLVVVYFPEEAGKGLVKWEDLGSSDLWDGRGLGGSQKGEVAYLQRKGIAFVEEDLHAFQRALSADMPSFRAPS